MSKNKNSDLVRFRVKNISAVCVRMRISTRFVCCVLDSNVYKAACSQCFKQEAGASDLGCWHHTLWHGEH